MSRASSRTSSLKKVAITTAAATLAGMGVCTCIALSQALTAPPTAAVTAPAPSAPPSSVQIAFTTMPPTDATVTWGKARLGRITPISPLVVVRPRDSGPLDVVVRAEGFLPVHTRAHTFADTRVAVKLTRPDETATLLGYRVPVDAGVPEAAPSSTSAVDPNVSPLWDVAPSWNMIAPDNMSPVTPAVPQ